MAKKRTTIIVDKDEWKKFKVKAAMHDETCTDVLNRFIQDYLSQPTPCSPPNPNSEGKGSQSISK